MNTKTPHTGGASENHPHTTVDTTLCYFTGEGADWPPLLAERLPARLEQIGGRPANYEPPASHRHKHACGVCGQKVRADLTDGSTQHDTHPAPGVTVRGRLCRACANAAGIPDVARVKL